MGRKFSSREFKKQNEIELTQLTWALVYQFKPGSLLCDKHNTSEISISISTRKKEHGFTHQVLTLFCFSIDHTSE